jgi:hypothetical protein
LCVGDYVGNSIGELIVLQLLLKVVTGQARETAFLTW